MAVNKLIFIFFLMVIVGGCQAPVTTEEAANRSDSITNSDVVLIDSVASGMNTSEMHHKSQREDPQVRDTLIVKSKVFEVNKQQCYWEYTVERLIRATDQEHDLRIIQMQLKEAGNQQQLFAPENSPDFASTFYKLKELEDHPDLLLQCKDINADQWCDYEILFERAAAGANTTTTAFLYNPANGKFDYSELFSGTNVEYDPKKNMIKTFWKMSVGDYTMTYTYLKSNKRAVDYVIEERFDADSVITIKLKNGKEVSRRKKALEKM